MIGKPLCAGCSQEMYEAGYTVKYVSASRLYAICAKCGGKKRVHAYLMSNTVNSSVFEETSFPCKKGDVIYTISEYGGSEIKKLRVDAVCVSILCTHLNEQGYNSVETVDILDFGRTAFLSAADAVSAQEGEPFKGGKGYLSSEQISFYEANNNKYGGNE